MLRGLTISMASIPSPQHAPLRFVSLKDAYKHLNKQDGYQTIENENLKVTDDMKIVHSSVAEILDKEEWLLEADQHIEVPSTSLDSSKTLFSLNDFVLRADEAIQKDLEAAAYDGTDRRLLTVDQERELHQKGQLSVPSVLVKNQVHIWKVASWFYSGIDSIRNSFWGGVGVGLDHLLIYTWSNPDSTYGWLPSWPNTIRKGFVKAFKILVESIHQLISAPIRPPLYSDNDIQSLLKIAENGYIRHHLENQGYDTRRLGHDKASSEGWLWDELLKYWDPAVKYIPPVSYAAEVATAAHRIDAERKQHDTEMTKRRHNELDYSKVKALQSPLNARNEARRAGAAWDEKVKQELIEYYRSLDDPLFHTEAKRLEAKIVEEDLAKADDEKIHKSVAAREDELIKERPFLSLSKAWLQRSLIRYSSGLKSELDASRTERVISLLEDQGGMGVELEQRRLRVRFREEHEQTLHSKLAGQRKSLTREFRILQLSPRNWNVDYSRGNVDRYKTAEVKLDQWFWRLRCMWYAFLSTTLYLTGSSYHFFFNGPLSLRALVAPSAFYALESDPDSLTPTLASRLRSFHNALADDRAVFEAKPDVGLIGKNVQRIIFRINAFLKATVGSLLIFSFMLLGSILCTLLTGFTLLTSPFLAFLLTALVSCGDILLYDRYAGTSGLAWKILRAVYCLLVPGVLQGAFATLRHVVFHPSAGIIHIAWASTRSFFRTIRDSLTGCILFRVARIPVDDTFLARRIHGPGMSSLSYLRLPIAAAKTSVELVLHQALVNAHIKFHVAELQASLRCYTTFMDTVLSPFGFKAILLAYTPESICDRLISYVNKHTPDRNPRQEFTPIQLDTSQGLWDEIGSSIRRAHPDVKMSSYTGRTCATNEITGPTVGEYEFQIRACLQNGTTSMQAFIPYDVMSIRTGQLLADLQLRRQFRGKFLLSTAGSPLVGVMAHFCSIIDDRMSHVVAIPSHARGNFRLADVDMQDLWDFTLQRTEEYADRIRNELTEMARKSAFEDTMAREAGRISESFWQQSNARPMKDLATVASHLLSTLLGGDIMLESLEETDETLIIEPVFSDADAHLIFWDHAV